MDDVADFFCEIYDSLDPEVAVRRLPEVRAGRRRHRRNIAARVADGTYDISRARRDIEQDPSGDMAILHLLGMDGAFQRINPFTATNPPAALESLTWRYARHGRFSSSASGALVPRAADPGRPNQEPAAISDGFSSVIRVPAEAFGHNNHAVLPLTAQLAPDDIVPALRVGCVPLAGDADEMTFEERTYGETAVYRITVDSDAMEGRITEVLEHAAAEEIALLVLPELVCDARLAGKWAVAARESVARGSKLRWLFSGTGDLRKTGRPVNAGVLIDATTGGTLIEQSKTMAFTLTQKQIESWKLPLRNGPLDEDIERGLGINVVETGIGRLAVLICEDLAETSAASVDATVAFGTSHVIAPVFSEPTNPQYWEHQKAKSLATAAGTTTIVSNSLVVGRLQDPGANPDPAVTPWK